MKRGATSLCQCMVFVYGAKTTSFSENHPDSVCLNVVQKSNSFALCFENTNQFILGMRNYAAWPHTSLLSGTYATTTYEPCSVEDPRFFAALLVNLLMSGGQGQCQFGQVLDPWRSALLFWYSVHICNRCTLTILGWDIRTSREYLEVKNHGVDNRCVLFGVLCSRFQMQCG